jgi:hypothetical protein
MQWRSPKCAPFTLRTLPSDWPSGDNATGLPNQDSPHRIGRFVQ